MTDSTFRAPLERLRATAADAGDEIGVRDIDVVLNAGDAAWWNPTPNEGEHEAALERLANTFPHDEDVEPLYVAVFRSLDVDRALALAVPEYPWPDPPSTAGDGRPVSEASRKVGELRAAGRSWHTVADALDIEGFGRPWTVADRKRIHDAQARRNIEESAGWIARDGDGSDVAAGPTREAAMHLARELGLAIDREGGGLRAWPATAGELDALAEFKSPAAMGRVPGAVPWWRESDQ